jgi:hypothetical protein
MKESAYADGRHRRAILGREFITTDRPRDEAPYCLGGARVGLEGDEAVLQVALERLEVGMFLIPQCKSAHFARVAQCCQRDIDEGASHVHGGDSNIDRHEHSGDTGTNGYRMS